MPNLSCRLSRRLAVEDARSAEFEKSHGCQRNRHGQAIRTKMGGIRTAPRLGKRWPTPARILARPNQFVVSKRRPSLLTVRLLEPERLLMQWVQT